MEWISVKDGLPFPAEHDDSPEYILVMVVGYGWQKAFIDHDGWYSNCCSKIVEPVTHWMKVNAPD
jgi:hypothetical protein